MHEQSNQRVRGNGLSYYSENRPEQVEFYKSKKWQRVRNAYFKKARGLCERCLAKGLIVPGEIVHHKIEMDSVKIRNDFLALNYSNLQLVCRKCHEEIHEGARKKERILSGKSQRYHIDENGVCVVHDDGLE